MRLELDESHERLVREAVAAGRAADATSYVQSLIDDAAADRWVAEHRKPVETLLRDRLQQPDEARPRDDFAALRQDVEQIVEQRQSRRTA
jgi:Arc/MetJ-type ribon-helix-helix transcriptional regulator